MTLFTIAPESINRRVARATIVFRDSVSDTFILPYVCPLAKYGITLSGAGSVEIFLFRIAPKTVDGGIENKVTKPAILINIEITKTIRAAAVPWS